MTTECSYVSNMFFFNLLDLLYNLLNHILPQLPEVLPRGRFPVSPTHPSLLTITHQVSKPIMDKLQVSSLPKYEKLKKLVLLLFAAELPSTKQLARSHRPASVVQLVSTSAIMRLCHEFESRLKWKVSYFPHHQYQWLAIIIEVFLCFFSGNGGLSIISNHQI